MDKLKKKIIIVLFCILTFFLVAILCIFNYQDYNNEKNKIMNNIIRLDERNVGQLFKFNDNPNENTIFMDATIYTVFYNNRNEVESIINYSNNEIVYDEIEEIANNILNKKNNITNKIGNLYFQRYIYTFKEHNRLIIFDNYNIQHRLINTIKTSIIIFLLLEIVVVIVVLKITNWIIKPVIESFNKQKTFISDASHELKTPISVIIANGEALENEPTEKKWLKNIKSEAERMSKLVSDLLDLTRLENEENKECFNSTNLSKLTEKSVLTFESIMYEKKIKFKYNIQEDIEYRCNDNQIKQLIAILVDNAIEYTEEDNEITVELKKEKNDIILNVKNQGKEIPKEIREKIFERFYRADESRNRDSNNYGLGLAIGKNIVTNHNGKISVNCLNGYTTFTVILR